MANATYIPFRGRNDQCQNSYPAMVAPAGLVAGSGSPEGIVFGNPGQRYRDLDNDNLYVKKYGTQSAGWVLVGKYGDGGFASGASSTLYSGVDPTNVISVTGPAMCIGTDAVNGQVWIKTTSANSSADWFPVIV